MAGSTLGRPHRAVLAHTPNDPHLPIGHPRARVVPPRLNDIAAPDAQPLMAHQWHILTSGPEECPADTKKPPVNRGF